MNMRPLNKSMTSKHAVMMRVLSYSSKISGRSYFNNITNDKPNFLDQHRSYMLGSAIDKNYININSNVSNQHSKCLKEKESHGQFSSFTFSRVLQPYSMHTSHANFSSDCSSNAVEHRQLCRTNRRSSLLTTTPSSSPSSRSLLTGCRSRAIFIIGTEEDFENKVMRSSLPVVVNFHADWCEPCHALKPLLQELAEKFEGKLHLAEVSYFHKGIEAASFNYN